jgi:hypothetical protein
MTHRHGFEAFDRCARDLMRTELPFGGKLIVIGGDFRETPRVVKASGALCAGLVGGAHAGKRTHAPRFNISPEENLPFQVCPPPVPRAAGFCSDHQQGAGADAAARGCLPAPAASFPRPVVCCCVRGRRAGPHQLLSANGHVDGLEGVYTKECGVPGADSVSTSLLCSAVLVCSVTDLLSWCVHCTCTLRFCFCACPTLSLPGSLRIISQHSPHSTSPKPQLP